MGLRRLFGRGGERKDDRVSKRDWQFTSAATSEVPKTTSDRGLILVFEPGGKETRLPLSGKPVTIGSAADRVDIAIDDEDLLPIHMRITPLPGGDFRVHGLSRPASTPLGPRQPDEFLLVHSGDQIKIVGKSGDYVVHFFSADAVNELQPAEGVAELRPLDLEESADFRGLRLRSLRDVPDAYDVLYEDASQNTLQSWEDRYAMALRADSERIFVIGARGALFGCVRVSLEFHDRSVAEVTQFWVNPGQRRQGAGALLLDACERWASEHGCASMTLLVTQGHAAAIRVFVNAGFAATGETQELRPASALLSHRMTKSLEVAEAAEVAEKTPTKKKAKPRAKKAAAKTKRAAPKAKKAAAKKEETPED